MEKLPVFVNHLYFMCDEWTAGECEYELEPCISKKWASPRNSTAAVTDSVTSSKTIKAIQQRRRGLKNYFKKLDN